MRCARRMPPISSARLKVIGEVAAGRPFERKVGKGEAVRIFTGGVIPDGADAVIIQEDTGVDGDHITITEAAVPGRHIRARRRRFPRGRRAAHARAPPHRPRFVARRRHELSGACGAPPPESRGPRHRRRAGDAGRRPPAPARSSIPTATRLRALARAEGAEVVDLGIAADTVAATTEGIRRAREADADILITMGGASVGDHDLVKRSLEAEGTTMAFWRIAMRPGKPMMHGRLGAMRVIGLPGNPVSSYVCGFLFLVPLIRALIGPRQHPSSRAKPPSWAAISPPTTSAKTIFGHASKRATDGTLIAVPVNHQDSSLLGNLAAARALVIRPPFAPAAAKGSRCELLRLPE